MLIEHIKDKKTISIVGIAKNSGKTVTMNRLIAEIFDEGKNIGLTTIGRDGESVDLVTETEKPKIFLERSSLYATTEALIEAGDASVEIMKKTDYRTPMGEVIIAKVREAGYVQIAGPQLLSEQKDISDLFLSLGADIVIIDGAIDRVGQADPVISDAAILATGAVVSRDMNIVIDKTVQLIESLSLPLTDSQELLNISEHDLQNVIKVDRDGNTEILPHKSILTCAMDVAKEITEETKYLYIPGSLTYSAFKMLETSKFFKELQLVVRDGTRIFIEPMHWKRMQKSQASLAVIKEISLVCVTVNPFSPKGYYFDSDLFIEGIKAKLPNMPVVDVMKI